MFESHDASGSGYADYLGQSGSGLSCRPRMGGRCDRRDPRPSLFEYVEGGGGPQDSVACVRPMHTSEDYHPVLTESEKAPRSPRGPSRTIEWLVDL